MYARYQLSVWFEDLQIYDRYFKSLNNAIKVSSGFDSSLYLEIYDSVLDKTIENVIVHQYIKELCSDCERY